MTRISIPEYKTPQIGELWSYNGQNCFVFSDGIAGPLMFKFEDGSDMPVRDYMVDGEEGFEWVR